MCVWGLVIVMVSSSFHFLYFLFCIKIYSLSKSRSFSNYSTVAKPDLKMPFLMDLPCEVLKEIILKVGGMEDMIILKVGGMEDVISLGSFFISLARMVGQERLWRVMLALTELVEEGRVREDKVRKITTFASSLNQTVYMGYPAIGWEEESMGVSSHHSVSVLGLELLLLITREAARLPVNNGNCVRNPWKSKPMMFFYLY